jgi:branched-chain amino acid transport system ATP-binding protein
MPGTILSVRNLTVHYGPIQAVRGIDLDVAKGEIIALLGANGAGKSSTLNAIMGLIPASGGEIRLQDQAVTGLPPEAIVRRGMTLTPEGRQVFSDLTVAENLTLGSFVKGTRSAETNAKRAEVLALFPVLQERLSQTAGTLSGGEQQQLAIARSLMSDPAVLLLDEPSLGLAPQIVDRIFDLIVELRRRGLTILLVEQNVELSLDIADRAYVLSNGAIVLAGGAAELRETTGIERTYLGRRA